MPARCCHRGAIWATQAAGPCQRTQLLQPDVSMGPGVCPGMAVPGWRVWVPCAWGGSARLEARPCCAQGCCRERPRQLPALPSVLPALLPVLLLPTSHHLRDLVISQRSQKPSKQLNAPLHNPVLTAGTRWGQCQVSSPTPCRAGTAAPVSGEPLRAL